MNRKSINTLVAGALVGLFFGLYTDRFLIGVIGGVAIGGAVAFAIRKN